jgi:hypothetical protein
MPQYHPLSRNSSTSSGSRSEMTSLESTRSRKGAAHASTKMRACSAIAPDERVQQHVAHAERGAADIVGIGVVGAYTASIAD